MQERRNRRKMWWFAGGLAAGFLGYLAVRYPVESATKVGAAHLKLLGGSTREIPWAGGTIRYVMLGRGDTPLVVVHGIGDSPESFGLFCQGMLSKYRICLPILPGHPGTPAPPGLQLGHMVQALDTVILREFGGRKVHLLGNSLGGWVSALFAAAASERLASLILNNPAGQMQNFRHEHVVPRTTEQAGTMLRAAFGPVADRAPAFFKRAYARGMAARSEPAVADMMAEAPTLVEPLERITTRTLVVAGEYDRLIPPEISLRIAEQIPHATFELIPRGSHLSHLTEPKTLQRIVNRHVRDPHLLNA